MGPFAGMALIAAGAFLAVRAIDELMKGDNMFDCSKEMAGYHNDEVTLPKAQQDEMRERRNANRKRLKDGLKKAGKPAPLEFKSQGSYAMKIMVQHPEKKYDIDDGVYFAKEDLKGPNGGEMSALDARKMVRDALDDGSFKTPPEVRPNCVRVHYDAGYHVDIPVYRRVVTKNVFGTETIHYELASSDWKRSDARDVTEWFEKENNEQSPHSDNGRQLRRMTRDIKKFARSRPSWEDQILSGFGITKLVTERYRANAAREDTALYDTMKALRDRLEWDLVVKHPVTPNEMITKGENDPKARFLRDKLSDALTWLEVLFDPSCTREQALKAWDKVFNTTYFTDQLEDEDDEKARAALAAPAILTAGLLKAEGAAAAMREPVRKEGGGRYA